MINPKHFPDLPNPAKDEFTLSIDQENTSGGLLTIYRLDGQKAGLWQIESQQTTVDISSFTPGVYLLQVEIDGNLFSKRLIKK